MDLISFHLRSIDLLIDGIRRQQLVVGAGGVDPARIEKEIPFAGVLLKKDKDLQTLRKVK